MKRDARLSADVDYWSNIAVFIFGFAFLSVFNNNANEHI